MPHSLMRCPPTDRARLLGACCSLLLVGCQPGGNALLYPREDVAVTRPDFQLPDLGDLGPDATLPDFQFPDIPKPPETLLELYDNFCEDCHPGRGQRATPYWATDKTSGGPELVGVLTHNSRESTLHFIRFGGGTMPSMETSITDEQAALMLDTIIAPLGGTWQLPATGDAARGRAYFTQHCTPCHPQDGGTELLVPEIKHVGQLVTTGFLEQLLAREMGTMPLVQLTPEERSATIRFMQQTAAGQAPAAGDRDAFTRKCENCHIDGGQRTFRVPVVQEGGWLTPAGLIQLSTQGQGEMPSSVATMTEAEALDLQAFLRTVTPTRSAPGAWPPRGIVAATADAVARGRTLYANRCQLCHGEHKTATPPLWPDLRRAGYLHTPVYLRDVVKQGIGVMPAYPTLSYKELTQLSDYMIALAKEASSGARVPEDALYRRHCEGCHQQGGRTTGYESSLGFVGQDLTPARLQAILTQGLGSMVAIEGLGAGEIADLTAFFQDGLADPAPQPQMQSLARQTFTTHCEACHIEGGLTYVQFPGVGDIFKRGATSAYLNGLVNKGLGWMPAIPAAFGALPSIDAALRAVANNQPIPQNGQLSYDQYCQRCHLGMTVGDEVDQVMIPTVVHTVSGRLSPAFMEDLLGGLGTMVRITNYGAGDAGLRAYLDTLPGKSLNESAMLPPPVAAELPASRAVFESYCGMCHLEQGVADTKMPKMAQKLGKLSSHYIRLFLERSEQYGTMPKLTLSGNEMNAIQSAASAARNGSIPANNTTYKNRCSGCHPIAQATERIFVPNLVATGRRLSKQFMIEASREGIGTMTPALDVAGQLITEAQVAQTFSHLGWLAGQTPRAYLEPPPPDPALVRAGKAKMATNLCSGGYCHGNGPYPLTKQGDYIPLEGLSKTLLAQVTRLGMVPDPVPAGFQPMPAFGPDKLTDAELAQVVEYMYALGLGQTP